VMLLTYNLQKFISNANMLTFDRKISKFLISK